MKIPRFLFSFISTAYSLLLATLYLMQLSPRNRKAMHMQSRVLKNERRLFAWRGGRGTRSCEELLWLGMNNVCRVNSQPRAWLCCPSLEGLTLLCTTLCLPACGSIRRAYPCPAASCYIAKLLFKNFLNE